LELKPLVKENLNVLFVGMNPCPYSAKVGKYFALNKSFWYQLYEAGILPKVIDSTQILNYNMGIMNLVDRPTSRAFQITEEEWQKGVERLKEIIDKYTPKYLCFIGKLPYVKYSGKIKFDYGWQDEKHFVMIFPTLRNVPKSVKIKILKELKNKL